MSRRTALITGASGGIGRDFAILFAKDGCDVVLVARGEAKLRELANEISTTYATGARVVVADLAQPGAAKAIAEAVRDLHIDVLVNNAGYGLGGAFTGTDIDVELAMVQVNVSALIHLTKLFLPAMVQRGHGRVLNVASTAAFQPGPFMAVYYATKAFVLSFSEAIAEELSGSGVTVTALCPGPTETGFAVAAEMTKSRLFTRHKAMSSRKVAEIGYRAMKRGKRVVIAGAMNRVMAEAVRVTPRRLVVKVTRSLQEP